MLNRVRMKDHFIEERKRGRVNSEDLVENSKQPSICFTLSQCLISQKRPPELWKTEWANKKD